MKYEQLMLPENIQQWARMKLRFLVLQLLTVGVTMSPGKDDAVDS
jgi:hypothetical protein